MKLDGLERRVAVLEMRLPITEDAEKRRLDEFLSRCSDEELYQLIKITEKDEPSLEDIVFMETIQARYEADRH